MRRYAIVLSKKDLFVFFVLSLGDGVVVKGNCEAFLIRFDVNYGRDTRRHDMPSAVMAWVRCGIQGSAHQGMSSLASHCENSLHFRVDRPGKFRKIINVCPGQ